MAKYKRVVVKVGTKVITSRERGLDVERICNLASDIAQVSDKGVEVLLVTSGAIGAGMWLLNLKRRPTDLAYLQAAASIGQNHLMHTYSECFRREGYNIGQILLTQEDFNDRRRYLNIKSTINALLKHGAIPVINENDTVATDEIRCGDNDRLSSLVADLSGADCLIVLSDVDGLLDQEGKLIPYVEDIGPKILKLAGKSSCDMGTGGMATKIDAARTAVKAGIECVIANGRTKDVIQRVTMLNESIGTSFKVGHAKFIAKKRWIAFSSRPKGVIGVDEGARTALCQNHKSLLASGISSVSGDFNAGDVVMIAGPDQNEFARGIATYSSDDLRRIRGAKSNQFKNILGYKGPDEVIHKDNLVIL